MTIQLMCIVAFALWRIWVDLASRRIERQLQVDDRKEFRESIAEDAANIGAYEALADSLYRSGYRCAAARIHAQIIAALPESESSRNRYQVKLVRMDVIESSDVMEAIHDWRETGIPLLHQRECFEDTEKTIVENDAKSSKRRSTLTYLVKMPECHKTNSPYSQRCALHNEEGALRYYDRILFTEAAAKLLVVLVVAGFLVRLSSDVQLYVILIGVLVTIGARVLRPYVHG